MRESANANVTHCLLLMQKINELCPLTYTAPTNSAMTSISAELHGASPTLDNSALSPSPPLRFTNIPSALTTCSLSSTGLEFPTYVSASNHLANLSNDSRPTVADMATICGPPLAIFPT